MAKPFSPARASHYAALFTLAAALQTGLPTSTHARDAIRTEIPDAVLSSWGEFSSLLTRSLADMAKAVEFLPAPDSPLSPTILTIRRACFDRHGVTSSDCAAAVSFVCRQHGFESGSQIDAASGQVCHVTPQGYTQTAHAVACKPKVWLTQVACW